MSLFSLLQVSVTSPPPRPHLSQPEYKVADPICTFLFSVFVLCTTITILRDVFRILMEGISLWDQLNGIFVNKAVARLFWLKKLWRTLSDSAILSKRNKEHQSKRELRRTRCLFPVSLSFELPSSWITNQIKHDADFIQLCLRKTKSTSHRIQKYLFLKNSERIFSLLFFCKPPACIKLSWSEKVNFPWRCRLSRDGWILNICSTSLRQLWPGWVNLCRRLQVARQIF